MRRTVLLGSVTPIVALAFLSVTQTILLAQTPKPESPKAAPRAAPVDATYSRDTIPVEPEPGFHPESRAPEVSAPAIGASPIRQRFIELSKKKALALTEEQLKREVDAMEVEVRELEAWAKAQEAVRLLHEVIEKHPNTKAAETANAAIQLIEQGRNPLIEQRRGVPVFPTPKPFRARDEAPKAAPTVFDGNTSS